MSDRELRDALRDAAGDDDAARRRTWRVVRAAYADHEPRPRRRRRLAIAVAAALLGVGIAGVAAASAPHSAVGQWVRGVIGAGESDARHALVRVPGGGRLLVQAGDSAWVVSADGSKRRLGTYDAASWSPNGLFVIAWRERELTALDPGGRVRWSLARPERVAHARWAAVDGFRIAYLAGAQLRIVNGDGTADRSHGAARADVAPAWRPDDAHVLAYVDERDRVDVVAVDSGRRLWRSAPLREPTQLAWSSDGRRLLAATRRRLVLFDRSGRRRASRAAGGAAVRDVAWAPRGAQIAVVRRARPTGGSELALLDADRGLRERVLFSGPGRFGGVAWSPAADRLLLAWPDADQWLFLHPRGSGRLTAVANIARQFTPGSARPPFPRAVRWCCAATTRASP